MLMQQVIDILEEQMSCAEVTGEDLCDFLGVDPNENGGLEFSVLNADIVGDLFLSHTYNSGGTSTRILMKKLGIEHDYETFVVGEREDDEEE